jgi:hypothetical protein
MKTIFNILTLLILTLNIVNGQSMDKTLQKLIDNKLVERKQINDFEELLNNSETKSNAVYLSILFLSEYKKLTGHNYSQFGSYLSFGNDKLKPAEQTKINEELTQYLSKLKSCELLNEKQFNHFQSRINNSEFARLLQLLSTIIEKVGLKEHMNPEKLKFFADKLKSNEIVSLKYDILISDILQEKLQNPIDFLNYCNKAVIINEQDYTNEPEKYLELIHKKTASIMSELDFENFEFKVVLDSSISDNDSKFHDFVVSLKSNGKKYKQISSYHLYSPSKKQYYGDKINHHEYYNIFNKILTDLQSPYRLHQVDAYHGNAVEFKVFGIIALTKEQADILHRGDVYFTPSYENFKSQLTTKKIEHAIEEYKKIGLLSHLTSEQIEIAKDKISEQENSNLNDVLMAFPEVIYLFDTELSNLEDPYVELIKEYKKISHNNFKATEISDDFDMGKKNKVTVKFKIGSMPYSKILKIENDWIDTDFFSFIKSVVTEQNLIGQFYELYNGGQEVCIIFLTNEQHNYLRINKLLVFGDEMQTVEE